MTSALGCADEKVSVASSAADISDKHKLRLDADYDRLETAEISELIQFGPADHPAYLAGITMGMSRSASRRLAVAEAKKRDEDLQDWRKEQIGRRGQLVAEERAKSGAGAKKKAAALTAMGNRENGVGTPPRGATPVGVVGEVVKKSHHKKKPPRTEEETAVSHKRKHPNQYTHYTDLAALTVDTSLPLTDRTLLANRCAKWRMKELEILPMTEFREMKSHIVIVTALVMEKWWPVIEKIARENGISFPEVSLTVS